MVEHSSCDSQVLRLHRTHLMDIPVNTLQYTVQHTTVPSVSLHTLWKLKESLCTVRVIVTSVDVTPTSRSNCKIENGILYKLARNAAVDI